jgi:hypothetical protein
MISDAAQMKNINICFDLCPEKISFFDFQTSTTNSFWRINPLNIFKEAAVSYL